MYIIQLKFPSKIALSKSKKNATIKHHNIHYLPFDFINKLIQTFNLFQSIALSTFDISKITIMANLDLSKNDFLNKVWNFNISPKKWRFQSNRPAIVDFYASWCGPCKALAPILDELSDEYFEKVDFYKVNVDLQPELSNHFNVKGIPSLLFCPIKGEPHILQGLVSKSDLRKTIQELLLNNN